MQGLATSFVKNAKRQQAPAKHCIKSHTVAGFLWLLRQNGFDLWSDASISHYRCNGSKLLNRHSQDRLIHCLAPREEQQNTVLQKLHLIRFKIGVYAIRVLFDSSGLESGSWDYKRMHHFMVIHRCFGWFKIGSLQFTSIEPDPAPGEIMWKHPTLWRISCQRYKWENSHKQWSGKVISRLNFAAEDSQLGLNLLKFKN